MNAPSKIALWHNEPEACELLAQIDLARVEHAEPGCSLTGCPSSVIEGLGDCKGVDFDTIESLERLTKVRRGIVDRFYGVPFAQCQTADQVRAYLAFDDAQPDEWAALQAFNYAAQPAALAAARSTFGMGVVA